MVNIINAIKAANVLKSNAICRSFFFIDFMNTVHSRDRNMINIAYQKLSHTSMFLFFGLAGIMLR
jgi:hypothetical protein